MNIGSVIMNKRKGLGLTQQNLADQLHISFQAVSKWENGKAYPEVDLLPALAAALETSVDTLLSYRSAIATDYEGRYQTDAYYWGLVPSRLCLDIMRLMPPVKPLKVLDIGCGEGKDSVFLARNGYHVSALDIAETGLEKGRALAEKCSTYVDFFKADAADYRLTENYDIIFSSGFLHFIKPDARGALIENLKEHTNEHGLNVLNVFIDKPFVKSKEENRYPWKSGELFLYYHDWYFHTLKEEVFDCNSGGVPHQHCMDTMIAEKGYGTTI